METKKTLEEKAAERYDNPQEPYCFETDREQQWYRCGECDGYIAGATEQDRIARQEVYREIYSWLHYEYKYGKKKAGDVVDDIKRYCFEHAKSIQTD